MTTYALPRKPTVELFTPYTDNARVCTCRYLDEGTHLDTEIKIFRHAVGTLIVDHVCGSGLIRETINGLSLLMDEMYIARVRFKNETGWGSYSLNYYQRVASAKTYSALAVPSEPRSGGAIPLNPSFTIEIDRVHRFAEWQTQTNHFGRRLMYEDERQSVAMVWENLSATDAATLITFLRARIDATPGESFGSTDAILGTREWMVRDGTIEKSIGNKSQSGGYVWTVRAQCDEVIGGQPWTVGVSQVAGPDQIA